MDKRYDEKDVERIVAKRLKERDTEAWARGINGSLENMVRAIDDLSILLRQHMGQRFHAGGAEAFGELQNKVDNFSGLGFNELSSEQKAAFPELLRDYVDHKKEISDNKKEEDRFWQKIASISMAITVVVTILAASGFFYWVLHLFGG